MKDLSSFAKFVYDVDVAYKLSKRLNIEPKLECRRSYQIPEPQDSLVDVERVVHVAVYQPRRVDEGNQRELFGFGCRHLGVDVINQPVELGQRLEVRVEVEGGVASQGLPLAPAAKENFNFEISEECKEMG